MTKRVYHIVWPLLAFSLFSCQSKFGHDKVMGFDGQHAIDSVAIAQYLEKEIGKNPKVAENYVKLFDIKRSEDKLVEATNVINTALEKLPHNEKVLATYALWKLDDNKPEEALKALQNAGDKAVSNAGVLKVYALAYLDLKAFPRSLDYVNKALAIDKNDWQLPFIKAENYLHLHDTAQAMNYFSDAFQIHPNDSTFNKVFDLALAKGNKTQAGEYLKQYYQLRPDAKAILLRSAAFFRSENRMDTANALLKKYLRFYPNSSEGLTELSHNFYQSGRYDSAIFYADKAISNNAKNLDARLMKAKALDKRYRYNEAKAELETLVAMDSSAKDAKAALIDLNKKIAYLRNMKRIEAQKAEMDSIKPIKKIDSLGEQ